MKRSAYPLKVDGLALKAVLYRPDGGADGEGSGQAGGATSAEVAKPGALVLCHGLPKARWSVEEEKAYNRAAARLCSLTGMAVLFPLLRGVGGSEGNFGVQGWCRDLTVAIATLDGNSSVDGVWLTGSGVGGSVALSVAAGDQRARGVVALGAPAEFASLSLGSQAFLVRARGTGMIRDDDYPTDPHAWRREFIAYSPVYHIRRIPPRPVLLIHGARDEIVPSQHADRLLEAARESPEAEGCAEKLIVADAGTDLLNEGRMVEVVAEWLTAKAAGSGES